MVAARNALHCSQRRHPYLDAATWDALRKVFEQESHSGGEDRVVVLARHLASPNRSHGSHAIGGRNSASSHASYSGGKAEG
mgnify:CR=1 FL=1